MTELARVQNTDATTAADRNVFEQYAEAVSRNKIVGDLLKFSKGEYIAGQNEERIKDGTRLIANMDQAMIGWVKWRDGKPVDMQMGRIAEGFIPPKRLELGDDDKDAWEIDDHDRPRDPWRLTNYLMLKDPEGTRLFTFTTSSKGGIDAVGKLIGIYGKLLRQRPDEFPLIALKVASYKHRNKNLGRIYVPEFEVVGWASKAEFTDALATAHQAADDEEPETSATTLKTNGRGTSAPTVDTRF